MRLQRHLKERFIWRNKYNAMVSMAMVNEIKTIEVSGVFGRTLRLILRKHARLKFCYLPNNQGIGYGVILHLYHTHWSASMLS